MQVRLRSGCCPKLKNLSRALFNPEFDPYSPRVTVLEVIQRSSEFLAKKGVESPRLQIELLLAHQLQLPRLKLYLNFDRILTEAEMKSLRQMVTQRGERVPLQHLLGSTSFAGLEMQVGPEVLIPRPETELLAERAVGWIGSRRQSASPARVALDYGTGSGCLAIYLAVNCPELTVHAVDISSAALGVARANAERHQVANRIFFHESDGLSRVECAQGFDLVVSNPPYIPSSEIETLEPEVRNHDPRLALDGGTDGLTFYRRLASELAPVVQPEGLLLLELGDGQAEAVSKLLVTQNWVVDAIYPDYSARQRMLAARRG